MKAIVENYSLPKGFKGGISKRLFRFLDKRFYMRKSLSFDLEAFACEKINLTRHRPLASAFSALFEGENPQFACSTYPAGESGYTALERLLLLPRDGVSPSDTGTPDFRTALYSLD